jgi:hypothetical protein
MAEVCGRKLEPTKEENVKKFFYNGSIITLYSVSDEDFSEFLRRYKEQTDKIDNLTPEEMGNRKAQLEKCIKGSAKKAYKQ